MNVVLSRPVLRAMLEGFRKVVPRRPADAASGCVLFERAPEGNRLTATVSTAEETLAFRGLEAAPGDDGGPDAFLVPLDELGSIENTLGSRDEASIACSSERKLRIACTVDGRTDGRTADTVPVAEFPACLPAVETAPCRLKPFLAACRRAFPFASEDPDRHVLNAIFCDAGEKAVVATDGRRLVRFRIEPFPFQADLIVPRRRVLVTGLLRGRTAAAGLSDDGETAPVLAIDTGRWQYRTRCLEGTYPAYGQAIPDEHTAYPARIEISDGDARLACRAVGRSAESTWDTAVLRGGSEGVILTDGRTAETAERVVLEESVCEAEETATGAVGGRFLVQLLQAGFREVRLSDGTFPWRSEADEGRSLHVVMPLRLDRLPHPQAADPAPEEGAPGADDAHASDGAAGGKDTQPSPAPDAGENRGEEKTGAEHRPAKRVSKRPRHSKPRVVDAPDPDPLEQIAEAVDEARRAVRVAGQALSGLKSRLRAAEKALRSREKEYRSTRRAIESLKQAAGF